MSRPKNPRRVVTVIAKGAKVYDSTPYTGEVFNNLNYTGVIFRVKAATEVGTASLDIKIQAYNYIESEYYDIAGASLAQITSAGSTVDLILDPRITAVSNRAVAQPPAKRMRVYCAIGDATTEGFTFGVEAEFYD